MHAHAQEILIRAMKTEDLQRAVEIASSLATAPQWTADVYARAIGARAIGPDNLDNPVPRIALVVEADQRVMGFAVAKVLAPESELESFAVAEEMQGRGLGRELLSALFLLVKQADVLEMLLEVRESNQRAVSIYTQAGFVEIGSRRGYYRNPTENALIFRRQL